MIATQIRHAKLWLAGDARNWELADYEIDELKEGPGRHRQIFPDLQGHAGRQDDRSDCDGPVADVEAAVKAKDRAKFTAAFDKLTTACNTCHQSANRPFIVIQRPASSTFPNQSFAPKR